VPEEIFHHEQLDFPLYPRVVFFSRQEPIESADKRKAVFPAET